jgi:hypothetical protein
LLHQLFRHFLLLLLWNGLTGLLSFLVLPREGGALRLRRIAFFGIETVAGHDPDHHGGLDHPFSTAISSANHVVDFPAAGDHPADIPQHDAISALMRHRSSMLVAEQFVQENFIDWLNFKEVVIPIDLVQFD